MAVVILGGSGMLGSMMKKVLPDNYSPTKKKVNAFNREYLSYDHRVINCIGLIKPRIKSTYDAICVNSVFPYMLPAGSIQIATDCVYSGSKGKYVETDLHDAPDVYGKTKSLGEALHLVNLRCSIIGPEINNHLSLLDWFLAQKDEVNGFTNHRWNGVTTYHFAKIVKGMIDSNFKFPVLQHIVPADTVNKAELLRIIAKEFNHPVKVKPTTAPEAIDRTLSTLDPEMNLKLWQLAGYHKPPTIEQMIRELAQL